MTGRGVGGRAYDAQAYKHTANKVFVYYTTALAIIRPVKHLLSVHTLYEYLYVHYIIFLFCITCYWILFLEFMILKRTIILNPNLICPKLRWYIIKKPLLWYQTSVLINKLHPDIEQMIVLIVNFPGWVSNRKSPDW